MAGRAKRRVVGVGLVLFTLWPLAHRALVATWDVDPWKLGGWAMYVRPRFAPVVEVVPLAGPTRPAAAPFAFTPEDADAVDAFARRRLTLGELATPAGLAASLLAAHPELPGVVVRVRTRRLDLGTARLVEDVERHAFRRGPGGPARRVPPPSGSGTGG